MEQRISDKILKVVKKQMAKERTGPYVVAIDGRCASGKSTLAAYLKSVLDCSVIHMDHFFLQPHQRNEERLREPGGNVDYERFKEEVIIPLEKGEKFSYRIFDCHIMDFRGEVYVPCSPIIIVEGAYCCRPEFIETWDLKVFLDVEKEEQLRRIAKRNGEEQAKQFVKCWIPMEEVYLKIFDVEARCDIRGRIL